MFEKILSVCWKFLEDLPLVQEEDEEEELFDIFHHQHHHQQEDLFLKNSKVDLFDSLTKENEGSNIDFHHYSIRAKRKTIIVERQFLIVSGCHQKSK